MHNSDVWGNQADQESDHILDEADFTTTNLTLTEIAEGNTAPAASPQQAAGRTTATTPVLVTSASIAIDAAPPPTETVEPEDDMSDRPSCGTFQYSGDPATLGARWQTWSERWLLYIEATSLTETKQKATYLLLIGLEAYEIYKSLKKVDNTDTMNEIYAFMKAHFLPKRSVFTESCIFRRAHRSADEPVQEYAMRLRQLAAHCNFGPNLEAES